MSSAHDLELLLNPKAKKAMLVRSKKPLDGYSELKAVLESHAAIAVTDSVCSLDVSSYAAYLDKTLQAAMVTFKQRNVKEKSD